MVVFCTSAGTSLTIIAASSECCCIILFRFPCGRSWSHSRALPRPHHPSNSISANYTETPRCRIPCPCPEHQGGHRWGGRSARERLHLCDSHRSGCTVSAVRNRRMDGLRGRIVSTERETEHPSFHTYMHQSMHPCIHKIHFSIHTYAYKHTYKENGGAGGERNMGFLGVFFSHIPSPPPHSLRLLLPLGSRLSKYWRNKGGGGSSVDSEFVESGGVAANVRRVQGVTVRALQANASSSRRRAPLSVGGIVLNVSISVPGETASAAAAVASAVAAPGALNAQLQASCFQVGLSARCAYAQLSRA